MGMPYRRGLPPAGQTAPPDGARSAWRQRNYRRISNHASPLQSGIRQDLRGNGPYPRPGFRNVAIGEGTAPLVSLPASPTTLILPFDNTSGGANGTFSTGIALGNISGSSATVTATVWDTSGNQLASAVPVFFKAGDTNGHKSPTWAGNSHDSYLLNDATAGIPATAGIRGVVQFQVVGGALTGVGLRVRTVGSTVTFTSVPVTAQ